MTILKQLKQATQDRHHALESQLPLLNPVLSLEAYRRLLGRFYGYYAPLETRLLALPWWGEMDFDYAARLKTPQLQQDLLALGDSPAHVSQYAHCQALPTLDSLPQLLGCIYVIEGATLGGQVIIKHLQANLGLTPTTGAGFFNGYGAATGSHWQTVREVLSTLAAKVGHEPEIVAAANQTFQTMEYWLFPKAPLTTTL